MGHELMNNPGAAATATGAKFNRKGTGFQGKSTPKKSRSAMSLFAKDRHKRVARSIGYVLTVGTRDAWADFLLILLARLTTTERAALAFTALKSLHPDQAIMAADAAINGEVSQ